ncbi:MAG: ATP-binding protein [Candidatus Thermoplasmatota archaeon]|nr:ATP-binding protein [Candidatus Thermoplasmatota archaeon]
MVTVEDFKYTITLWNGLEIPDIVERDVKIDLDSNKIVAIAGVRRSGKTHVMLQCINSLLKRGIKRDNVLYVDFENERLVGVKATDLDNLLVAHRELFNPDGIVYVFLDEIQNVENWDKWVRKVYDTRKYRLIVTGSSSELLSSEIATSLAGRNLTYVVYPFSFEEYVSARGIKISRLQKYSTDRGIMLKATNDFLEFGAFPEIAFTPDISRRLEILSSYFDAIFFRDIVRRYKVREVGELNVFLRIISSNYASYFSSVKSLNYFKSIGMKISRMTILNFLGYAKSVFLVGLLEPYEKSVRKRVSRQSKSYIIDIGVSRLFSDIDKGRSLENAVYLELLRKKGQADTINYLRLKSGKEVDFIFGGRRKELIQVCYDVSDESTRSRETGAIVESALKLGLKKGTVITYDYEGKEVVDGISIQFIPFWIWAIPGMH